MGVELSLATARARASLQLRARGGGRGKRPKKMKGLARPAKTGPGAACGTGKGGFQSGNVCALEDGIPDKPKSFAKGGALKKSNPKADREKAAKLKAKAAAKQTAKQAADKKKSIAAKKKKAADRKQQKAAKQAADQKAATEAAAKKKQQMLQKIRVKKANKLIDVVGTPKSVAEQIKEAKTSLASKKLVVVKTPKSIKEEIEDIKAAQAAKEAAAKAKAEANAKAAYEKAKVEAAAAEKAAAEIAAKRAAEKGKPVPIKKVDDPEELAPKPPFTTPNPDQLTTVKTLGGSTGAVLAEANGQKFVVKAGKTPGHIANESQADELYAAAGVTVPRHQLHVDSSGVQKKVAEFVNGKTLAELKVQDKAKYDAAVERVKKDFAADVLFSNYDVVGMGLDNIVVKGGKVYRVDNGGSLTFRAQGKNKPFTEDISEISTLRDSAVNSASASVFGSLTDRQISGQVTKLLAKKEQILAAAKTEELRNVLDKRMAKMAEWQRAYKDSLKSAGPQPAVVKAKPPEFHSPLSGKTFDQYSTDFSFTSVHPTYAIKAPNGAAASVEEAIAKMQTHGYMKFSDRQAVGYQLKKNLTPGESQAFDKWTKTPQDFHRAEADPGSSSSYWKGMFNKFKSGLSKLPVFAGGPIHKGISGVSQESLKSWIESGKFDTRKNPSTTPVHSSFTTRFAKAWEFAGGEKGVVVTVTNSKTARDGVGLIGYNSGTQERELIVGSEARFSLNRAYLLWAKSASDPASKKLGLAPGQPISLSRYNSLRSKNGMAKHKTIYDAHSSDPSVKVAIEVEEIDPQPIVKAKPQKKKKIT